MPAAPPQPHCALPRSPRVPQPARRRPAPRLRLLGQRRAVLRQEGIQGNLLLRRRAQQHGQAQRGCRRGEAGRSGAGVSRQRARRRAARGAPPPRVAGPSRKSRSPQKQGSRVPPWPLQQHLTAPAHPAKLQSARAHTSNHITPHHTHRPLIQQGRHPPSTSAGEQKGEPAGRPPASRAASTLPSVVCMKGGEPAGWSAAPGSCLGPWTKSA